MITLDAAQTHALATAAREAIEVHGPSGTGKSVLANVLAARESEAGRSCLLIGSSPVLNTPIAVRTLSYLHPALQDRAQLTEASNVSGQPIPPVTSTDLVEVRAKADPDAARTAVRILRRTRELAQKHRLGADEIEMSLATAQALRSEMRVLAALAVQDGLRLADQLWTGNGRAGRTFIDVREVLTGKSTEVPADENALAMIRADETEFEVALVQILNAHSLKDDERLLSEGIATLRRPRSRGKTIAESHQHASWMAGVLNDANRLVRSHGSLRAALAADPESSGAKAIEFFMRMKSEQDASAALRAFDSALRDYQYDCVVLERFLQQHGARSLDGIAPPQTASSDAREANPGSSIQKIREARQAARELPGLLVRIKSALPPATSASFFTAPIEEAASVLENGAPDDERSRASNEVRQLRALFAETGFGDPLSVSADFEASIERAQKTVLLQPARSEYGPEVLDLLLDLTTHAEWPAPAAWPASLARARSREELSGMAASARSFDTVVVDDCGEYATELLDAFAASGARVHRIGVKDQARAISLETPHRSLASGIAHLATGTDRRWIGAPNSLGLVVRTAPNLTATEIASAAKRLVARLQAERCSVALASAGEVADVIVAALDELQDTDLQRVASLAGSGVIVICRVDRRAPASFPSSTPSADIDTAVALGWKISRTAADGTVLEKDGRFVILVQEAGAIAAQDDTVAERVARAETQGWHPMVAWRQSPRDRTTLAEKLNGSAVLIDNRFRNMAEQFDLLSPQAATEAASPVQAPNAAPVTSHPVVSPASDLEVATPSTPVAIAKPIASGVQESSVRIPEYQATDPAANKSELSADRQPSTQQGIPSAEVIKLNIRPTVSSHPTTPTFGENSVVRQVAPTSTIAASEPKSANAVPRAESGAGTKFRAVPAILEKCLVGSASIPVPHIVNVLVSTALQSRSIGPICILLPSTESVAQLVAILSSIQCLAADYPDNKKHFAERYLRPGSSVRILPDGNVYVAGDKTSVHGVEGVYMGYTDKETLDGDGKRVVPVDELLRFEPTSRQLPKSRSSIKHGPARPTAIDEIAEVRTFGNTGLYRNRVVLVGSRAEFERMLARTTLAPSSRAQAVPTSALAEDFAWGTFDENGRPFVLSPEGASGCPLVAIARNLSELEKASLDPSVEAGSQIILTDRLELVLNNLDFAGRLGERQRLIVFADAKRRSDAVQLRKQGWKVWEPRSWELLPAARTFAEPAKTDVPGVDVSLHSAFAEQRPNIGYLEKSAPHLAEAFRRWKEIDAHLNEESCVDDPTMQSALEQVRGLFFDAATWLSIPKGDRAAEYYAAVRHLRDAETYVGRYANREAVSALRSFTDAIERFASPSSATGITPKGDALLQLAKNIVQYPALKQVLVTGSRQSREEADAFLGTNGIDLQCKIASELTDASESPRAFSLLRRDMFDKFVDPWPSKSILLTGYEFEIEIYKKRLIWRESQKRRLEINPSLREDLTALPTAAFGVPPAETSSLRMADAPPADPDPASFGSPDSWPNAHGTRAIDITVDGDEETEQSHIVRFVGRSWMPMAADYRPLCIMQAGNEGRKSGVEHIDLADLRPGMRIIVREEGEKDVIKAIAQELCGDEKYDRLWQRASLWRDALKSGGSDPNHIARILQEGGVRRHVVTLRSWLTNKSRIGPRSDEDVFAIAKAFPLAGKTSADWQACCAAISELRGLHLSAGMKLTDHLVSRCGKMLFEPTETETAVEFELGAVWILEVAEVEAATRECPVGIVNRLQWLNASWHARMFGERVKVRVA
ncbi:hypothetical protein [Tardiphaga robiniae]|uniref:hypothetical protein n=1 Tax=Tardiphaga robiniae TaxID=943830 RepID=UPI00158619CE|nr:hypothetical protein [Tardiphaga robiniae]NUU41845.1 hypothetical protein [Tardiphaga robiniae]